MPIPTTSQQMGNPLYARLEGAYASGNATTPYSPGSASNGVYRVETGTSTSKPNFISPDGSTLYDSLGRPYKSEATQAYEASQSAQPSQNPSKPNAQSLAQTTPPKPQSLGRQIGGALLAAPTYFAGDYAGDRLSEATWGTSNGIGSQIGSFVGATVGGITGAALAGVPSLGVGGVAGGLIGTGFGAAVGSFIGGAFDTLGGLIFPSSKANPVADKGKGYRNPANLPVAPFVGGQMQGESYIISWAFSWVHDTFGSQTFLSGERTIAGVIGIKDAYTSLIDGSKGGAIYITSNGVNVFANGETNQGVRDYNLTILSIRRANGQPDVTSPSAPNANTPFVPNNPAPQGALFDGSPFDALGDGEKYQERTGKREPPVLPDATKPDPTKPRQVAPSSPASPPSPSPLSGSNPAYDGNKPAASSPSPSNSSSSSAEKQSRPNNGFSSTGMQPAFESKPFVAGTSNPNDYGKEIDNITGKERVTSPVVDPLKAAPVVTPTPKPNTPNAPATDNYDTAKILLGIGALAGTVTALKVGSDLLVNNSLSNTPKIDQIAQNTTNTNQQTNAKQGVCDAMQPSQCGFEGVKQATAEATEPIKDQTVANAGLLAQIISTLANLASTIANLFSNVVGKLDGIKEFLEKVARAAKLDKVYNLLTFITVIHNAQMLSGSLATTLMETLSLGLATVGIKDENESPIDIQSIINSTVENKVKGIIGVENYTVLSDRWKKAVRVYQAAANITYQVRSLWDSAKSLAELTGANVGKIGNALRRDGVVAENAYGAMADNPMAVNSVMTKLQNLDETASHLNSITSETYGVTETVAQIKKDQDDFKKLVKEGTSSTTPIVNDQQKAKDDAAKLASVSPPIATTDLAKPD